MKHIVRSQVLSLFVLLITSFVQAQGDPQEVDIFSAMRPTYNLADLIINYGMVDTNSFNQAIEQTKKQFKLSRDHRQMARGANTIRIQDDQLIQQLYADDESGIWVQFFLGDGYSLSDLKSKIGLDGKKYSGIGMGGNGLIYTPIDSTRNGIFNALFNGNGFVMSIGADLPFPIKKSALHLNNTQKSTLIKKIRQVESILRCLANEMVSQKDHMYIRSDAPLSQQERLYGFSQFWTEVKYNFAFFDQVPDLNWDQVYYDYLPVIAKDQSNKDYFRNMEKLCALLKDGHTGMDTRSVYSLDATQLALTNIGKKAIVENVSTQLSETLPRGTEILSVDGILVNDYLETNIFPYISSSTDHILWNDGIRQLLDGKTGSEVFITYKYVDGHLGELKLKRDQSTANFDWKYEWPSRKVMMDFESLDENIALVSLNTFADENIVKEFEGYISKIKKHEHVIIDLRNNGGGNSSIGYDILKYFAHKPFKTSRWQTREHKASYKAWGKFVEPAENNDEWEKECLLTAEGNYWYGEDGDVIEADQQIILTGKLIVLIGNHTASSAEDFLVALDDLGIGLLIGQPTYGSTGQPLIVHLPRGVVARICTKKDTYPDGREFVGYGVKPDILIEKTIEGLLSGQDLELDKAILLIRDR